jgi:hypothetical protein
MSSPSFPSHAPFMTVHEALHLLFLVTISFTISIDSLHDEERGRFKSGGYC